MNRMGGVGLAVLMAVVGLGCAGGGPSGEATGRQTQADGRPATSAESGADGAGAAAGASAGDGTSTEPPAGAAAPERWEMPVPALGYNAREGRALFQHYCSTCHGVEGRGDGFNAFNLDPKPRDLSDQGFQGEKSDDELADVISIGGGAAGLSTAMPPWGGTLSKRQVHNLVVYLRALSPES